MRTSITLYYCPKSRIARSLQWANRKNALVMLKSPVYIFQRPNYLVFVHECEGFYHCPKKRLENVGSLWSKRPRTNMNHTPLLIIPGIKMRSVFVRNATLITSENTQNTGHVHIEVQTPELQIEPKSWSYLHQRLIHCFCFMRNTRWCFMKGQKPSPSSFWRPQHVFLKDNHTRQQKTGHKKNISG